jgi:hypothetical protein
MSPFKISNPFENRKRKGHLKNLETELENIKAPENAEENFQKAFDLFKKSCQDVYLNSLKEFIKQSERVKFIEGHHRCGVVRLYPPETMGLSKKEVQGKISILGDKITKPLLRLNMGDYEKFLEFIKEFNDQGISTRFMASREIES